jgi:hypothetical protein
MGRICGRIGKEEEEGYQKWDDLPRIGMSIENGCWNPTLNSKREWRRRMSKITIVWHVTPCICRAVCLVSRFVSWLLNVAHLVILLAHPCISVCTSQRTQELARSRLVLRPYSQGVCQVSALHIR